MRWLFERRFVIFRIADARLDVHVSSSAHDRAAFANGVDAMTRWKEARAEAGR